jgi:hypothetical protein
VRRLLRMLWVPNVLARLRLSRRERTAALIGALGYAWALVVATPTGCRAILKPSAEDQQPYAPPGDSDHGDLKTMLRRVKDWPPSRDDSERECWRGMALWKDRAPTVRGRGPSNGSSVTHWVTETVNDEVYFGRYTFDLSYLLEPGTGAIGFWHAAQESENTRLIERIPPPPPGPPGWRVIQPGQCVFAKEEPADAEGTIGRFLIELPAHARVLIETVTSTRGPNTTFERLTFNGKEVAHEPIPEATEERGPDFREFYYRTGEAGRYALTKHIPHNFHDDAVQSKKRLRYSLMVVWGETGFTESCTDPLGDLSCLGDKDDD